MKASIQISTGMLIGSWNPADDDAMLVDAQKRGVPLEDVELREITSGELAALIAARDAVTMSYTEKRKRLYPPIQDALDAKIKMASPDAAVQAEGQAQWNTYVNACFTVKLLHPK